MTRRALWVLALCAALAGCSAESAPPAPRPFTGWVPEPSALLSAYADCLRGNKVPVDDVVGAFILVERAAEAGLQSAQSSCSDELDSYHATVLSNPSRTIPDQTTYTFIHQVRNCMVTNYQIKLRAEQTVLLIGEPGLTHAQFDTCVEQIRAYPAPQA